MDIQDKISKLYAKREAITEARDAVSAKQDKVFNQLMALSFDDEDYLAKHAELNGKFTALSNEFCDLTSQLTFYIRETKRAHETFLENMQKVVDYV